jgi:hypothetical protein
MVYLKPDGTFAIYDWKRSKEIKFENKYQKGLSPISHLHDCNYWHYSLQLNIYRRILEKFYNVVVSELALVILHPNNKSYQIVKLNMMDDEVQAMWDARAEAVKAMAAGLPNPMDRHHKVAEVSKAEPEDDDEPAAVNDECLIADD